MSGIAGATASSVSPDAYTKMYSPADEVPQSVLDVPPVSHSTGNFVADDVMEGVSTYNKLLYMSQHTSWDLYEAKFGPEATEKAKAEDTANIAKFGQNLMLEASVASVGVSSTANSGGDSGSSSGTTGASQIAADSQDYKSGGSVYSVLIAANGTVSVSKDGKAWRSYDGTKLITSVHNAHSMLPGAIAVQLLARKGPLLLKTA